MASKPEFYDWYYEFDALRVILMEHVDSDTKIIDVGCGNSLVPVELAKTAQEVVGLDYSPICIQQMKERFPAVPGLTFVIGDVTAMEYSTHYFDVVMEKGCLDAICSGQNYAKMLLLSLQEICRIMKPGGLFLHFTWAPLDGLGGRGPYLLHPSLDWDLGKVSRIPATGGTQEFNFCYRFVKRT
mmetsp:Transcript_108199/g.248113  ORF Transcript_108199/g.248113 Transcript_108199/m.248113 type:complete len:184 (-) Transcript_108199:363-914(-)